MRLTDARQLDALPERAWVAVHLPYEDDLSGVVKVGGRWMCPAKGVHLDPADEGPMFLLQATARTPEDLERLLPGAVLEDGTFLGGRDDEGRFDWYPPGTDDIARSAHMGFPVRILHPGNPIDAKEA